MIRRPPRSTLFPTRRSSDLTSSCRSARSVARPTSADSVGTSAESADVGRARSEEHTSELQSHLNLVCRLLLEKKNKLKKRPFAFVQSNTQQQLVIVRGELNP